MELVWVLWGVLSTLNVGLLAFTAINLKKTERLLKKVELSLDEEQAVHGRNVKILETMKNIVINE